MVVDASVWVAMLKEEDRFVEQAESIFQSIELSKETICIPAIVFTEVAGVIKRTMKDDNAAWRAVYHTKEMELNVFADFDKLEVVS